MEKSNEFIENLYLDPIKSFNIQKRPFRKFRLRETQTEEEEDKTASTEMLQTHQTTNQSVTLGSVIMQNWETKRQIPKDLPLEMMQRPVLTDRSKISIKSKKLKPLDNIQRYDFSKNKILDDGNKLLTSSIQRPSHDKTEIIARDTISSQLGSIIEKDEESKEVALTETTTSALSLPQKKKRKY